MYERDEVLNERGQNDSRSVVKDKSNLFALNAGIRVSNIMHDILE